MGNVLFISVDCLRSDHLGCYGYDRPTSPNIDEFVARERTTRYRRSYSNCPGTRWAFQSLHTGVSSARIDGLGIPDGYRSLATVLRRGGYATGGFAVNGFISREYNYDAGFDTYYSIREAAPDRSPLLRLGKRVYDHVSSPTLREKLLEPVYLALMRRQSAGDDGGAFRPDHTDADTAAAAVEYIRRRRDSRRPFFAWIHLMDAHTPYGHWEEHRRALGVDTDIEHTINPGLEGRVTAGEDPEDAVIDTYDACVRRTDEAIGRLLATVDENTTVVITGDHGEEFGRFGGFHEASLYSSMTRVPIIVRPAEGTLAGADTPVQHLDIPPTIVDAAGLEVPEHWEGDALQSAEARRRSADWPVFFSLRRDETAVEAGRWRLMETDGRRALFDLASRSGEDAPVDDAETKTKLGALLDEYQTTLDRDVVGTGERSLDRMYEEGELSDELEENLGDLGYL